MPRDRTRALAASVTAEDLAAFYHHEDFALKDSNVEREARQIRDEVHEAARRAVAADRRDRQAISCQQ